VRAPQPSGTVHQKSNQYRDLLKSSIKSWQMYEATMRLYFLPEFGSRRFDDLTRAEVLEHLETLVHKRSASRALETRKHIVSLYNWLYDRGEVLANPFLRMRLRSVSKMPKEPVGREFTDSELRVIWSAASSLGYPYGILVKLLLLTGARRDELADAVWSEVDLAGAAVHIPAERFKSLRNFDLALPRQAVELLLEVPKGSQGQYVFSTTYGRVPISGWHRFAKRLRDKCTEINGGKPLAKHRAHHDYRVTLRSRLSLDIPFEVREAVIGHARGDLERRYDVRDLHMEKVSAVQRWADELTSIVKMPSVINLKEMNQ